MLEGRRGGLISMVFSSPNFILDGVFLDEKPCKRVPRLKMAVRVRWLLGRSLSGVGMGAFLYSLD